MIDLQAHQKRIEALSEIGTIVSLLDGIADRYDILSEAEISAIREMSSKLLHEISVSLEYDICKTNVAIADGGELIHYIITDKRPN